MRRRRIFIATIVLFVVPHATDSGAISGSEPTETVATGELDSATGITVDDGGNLYIADTKNHRVQLITAAGIVSTVLGTTGVSGSGATELDQPSAVALDSEGNLYVADRQNHRIQKLDTNGNVTTVLGETNTPGSADNQLRSPVGIAIDDHDNLYVADLYNHRVQKLTPNGTISTVSGTTGTAGSGDNQFRSPTGVAVDSSGNVYVADVYNHRVQKITPEGVATTTAGTTGTPGSDGTQFRSPTGVTVDSSGNIYVADRWNHRIRKISTDGLISTVAGTTGIAGSESSDLRAPSGVAIDSADNLYIADTNNDRVQLIMADTVRPTISITSPSPSQVLRPGDLTAARFACSDTGGSQVASCRAIVNDEPVANGERLSLSPSGYHMLEVTAVDGQGHSATETVSFRILPSDETLKLNGQYEQSSGNSASVARLYMSALARQPDTVGHDYWVQQLDLGVSLQTVSRGFLEASEYVRSYGDLSAEEFVENLYINVLNRPAEMLGSYYWLMRLADDMSQDQVGLWFSESSEFKALTHTS